MKGIIKGSLFSLILILILSAIVAVVNMKISIPQSFLKGILWILSGGCIFAGVIPVTKSATNGKFLRGISSSFITVIMVLVIVCLAGKGIPSGGSFYAYGLICMLCGLLATLAGINF